MRRIASRHVAICALHGQQGVLSAGATSSVTGRIPMFDEGEARVRAALSGSVPSLASIGRSIVHQVASPSGFLLRPRFRQPRVRVPPSGVWALGLTASCANNGVSLTTDAWGVTVLSADDIEAAAEDAIRRFDPKVLANPRSTPILKMIERAHQDGLLLEWRDLSAEGGPGRLVGRFLFSPPTIQVDPTLRRSPQIRFVLAHEFAHFVLHRGLAVRADHYESPSILDSDVEVFGSEDSIAPARYWMEWQARRFAAAILVPRRTISEAVLAAMDDLRIVRKALSQAQFEEKLAKLVGATYAVSASVMRIRFRELELLPRAPRRSTPLRGGGAGAGHGR